MKENTDPHQVIISREYFDALVEMARPKDYPAGTKARPNQTMLARILRHVRKFNRQLHNERQVVIEQELVLKRLRQRKARNIVKTYTNSGKNVYVIDGDQDWPAVVHGYIYPSRVHICVLVLRADKQIFESVHVDNIILSPRG